MIKTFALWFPFVLVPAVAWSRDIAVVILVYGACAILAQRNINWRSVFAEARHSALAYLSIGFIVWSFAAVFWAPHTPLTTWFKVFALMCAGAVLTTGLRNSPESFVRKLERPAMAAALALLSLLLIERLTDGFLIRFDRIFETPEKILDVLSGGLVLLGCASFFIAWILWRKTESQIPPLVFMGVCLALSLSYRMDAIPAGLIFGMLSFTVVLHGRTKAFAALTLAVGILAIVWGPLATFASTMHFDAWLTDNVDHNWGYRIVIWQHVGGLLQNNIFFGYGFDSARAVGASADLFPESEGLSTFLHPHNGMLQIWLELGLVGVILLVGTISVILRRIVNAAVSRTALAAIAGTISFTATIWLLSYGVWQGWWMAVIGLMACSVSLILSLDQRVVHKSPGNQDSESATRYAP